MKKNWVTFVGALSLSALALGGCKSGDSGPEQPAEDDGSMKEPAAGDKTKTSEEKCSGGEAAGAGK